MKRVHKVYSGEVSYGAPCIISIYGDITISARINFFFFSSPLLSLPAKTHQTIRKHFKNGLP